MTKKEMQAELDRLRDEREQIAAIMIEDVGMVWLPATHNAHGKRVLQILDVPIERGPWGWRANSELINRKSL